MNADASIVIRKCTLAPIIAALLIFFFYGACPEIFGSLACLLWQLLLLTFLPLLAYPLQPVLPYFRKKGREGQRYLAILFAFLGYFLDVAVTLLTRASKELCLISWTYFLSGLLILILNRLCKIYASGHAAGVSMAICLPAALNHPEVLLVSVPLHFIVAWASVAAKRHTVQQYIIGALIPPMAMGLVQFVLYK